MFPIRSILSLSGMFLLPRPIRPPPILAYLNPSIHGPHFYLSLRLNSSHGVALVGGGGWGMHDVVECRRCGLWRRWACTVLTGPPVQGPSHTLFVPYIGSFACFNKNNRALCDADPGIGPIQIAV